MSELRLLAKTLHGLETVLAREVKHLGGRNVKILKRAVAFEGDLGFVYKANLWLRTALRILVEIDRFKARNENEIYKKVKSFPWEKHFDVDKTIVVDATVFAPQYPNSLFIAQKIKDGIADRFREKTGRRPNVDTRNADIRINAHLSNENITISLDSSGDSLHKRGYRHLTDRAPLSEVLAAGIIQLTGWEGHSSLIDPMCGSGTFLIESALLARNIPPNVFRKEFSFKNWSNFDEKLYDLIFEKALEKEKEFTHQILGFDQNFTAISKAKENSKTALLEEDITVEYADFMHFTQTKEIPKNAMLLFNPPYGKKMEADIPALYKGIGDTLKNKLAGHTAWIFTASKEGLKNVGLKPSKKIQLYNGKLESWLMKYEMWE